MIELSTDWRDQASCLGLTWMAEEGHARDARAVCRTCPVLEPCRSYGLTEAGREIPGVLGGLTQAQRGGDLTCQGCGNQKLPDDMRNGYCWHCWREGRAA